MAKKIPQINASSMADISFLLLIFFLVTTSMDVNQGLARRLPAPVPPDQKVEDTEINKRNLMIVKINSLNQLMVQGQLMEVRQLREEAKKFILKKDKKRKRYHNYHVQGKWGDSRLYDLSVNSSRLGIDKTVDMLEDYIKARIEAMK